MYDVSPVGAACTASDTRVLLPTRKASPISSLVSHSSFSTRYALVMTSSVSVVSTAVALMPRKRKHGALPRRQQREFNTYQQSITEQIPHLLHTALPTQILRLHHLVQSLPPYTPTPLTPPEPPLPAYRTPDTSHLDKTDAASYVWRRVEEAPPSLFYHPVHPQLTAINEHFRPVLFALYGQLSALSHFLLLSLPSLDETSNATLTIPQAALGSCRRTCRLIQPYLHPSHYHSQRGLLLERCVKYGWEVNMVMAVEEWDEREYVRVRNGMRECVGRLMMLWDLLRKNADAWLEQPAFDIQRT